MGFRNSVLKARILILCILREGAKQIFKVSDAVCEYTLALEFIANQQSFNIMSIGLAPTQLHLKIFWE